MRQPISASSAEFFLANAENAGHNIRRICGIYGMYIWEKKDWPALTWYNESLSTLLASVSRKQGRLLGRMEGLGFGLRTEANLQTLTEDVVKSNEIEGERLNSDQVRSSIARRLGIDVGGLVPTDRVVEGVVEMMLDATGNYVAPLTTARLFDWHAAMFPPGRSGMRKIIVRRAISQPSHRAKGLAQGEADSRPGRLPDRVTQLQPNRLDYSHGSRAFPTSRHPNTIVCKIKWRQSWGHFGWFSTQWWLMVNVRFGSEADKPLSSGNIRALASAYGPKRTCPDQWNYVATVQIHPAPPAGLNRPPSLYHGTILPS